jgi:hypothetical protein
MAVAYRKAAAEWRPPVDPPESPSEQPERATPSEIPGAVPEAAPPAPAEIPSARAHGSFLVSRGRAGPLTIALAALLAQGCATAPLVWTKPGAEASAARGEIAECRVLAADQMWRMTWEEMWPPRFYDPRFMPPYYRAARPFWLGVPHSLELERSLVEFCMHSKGYQLSAPRD